MRRPHIPVTGHLNDLDVSRGLQRDSFGFMSYGQDLHSDLEKSPSCDSWFHLRLRFSEVLEGDFVVRII